MGVFFFYFSGWFKNHLEIHSLTQLKTPEKCWENQTCLPFLGLRRGLFYRCFSCGDAITTWDFMGLITPRFVGLQALSRFVGVGKIILNITGVIKWDLKIFGGIKLDANVW